LRIKGLILLERLTDSRFKLDAIIRTDDLDRPEIIQSIDLSVNDEWCDKESSTSI